MKSATDTLRRSRSRLRIIAHSLAKGARPADVTGAAIKSTRKQHGYSMPLEKAPLPLMRARLPS